MTRILTTATSLAVLAAAAACNLDSTTDPDQVDEVSQPIYDPSNPPTPVATDLCDDPTYAADAYLSQASAHIVAYYLPGTAAETDIASILSAREAAYSAISSALGLSSSPTISVYLSPNRLAAQAHGRGYGNAYPGSDRYEAVYTGAADSFEVARVGNLLARTLEYYVDTANPKRIGLLSVGLAEVLDQASPARNLHDAYAQQLLAAVETRVHSNSFEASDVTGKNVGRAGSLVRFLIDRYGMTTFLNVFKATAVASVGACANKSVTYGCINSAATLTAMLDGVLTSQAGESWNTVAAAWKTTVDAHMASASVLMKIADRNAITNLVNLMDQGIVTQDAAVYRSTMEGFYCEWGGDAGRDDIATRTLASYQSSTAAVQRILPTAMANFPTARVWIRRLDERSIPSFQALTVEHFPQGWRVTYGTDWW